MQYLGSKNRIAKHILPVMLEARQGRCWAEPFVGGANMIDKVDGERLGADIHHELIALLTAVRDGWTPPTTVTKEEYYYVKSHPQYYTEHFVGFVGFLCSFGGKWWGGYAANAKGDNYANRGSRMLVKQAASLKGISFQTGEYNKMSISKNSLIYCDPPYQGTTGYKDAIDHAAFWQWCREKVSEGHIVFISEYSAPPDFRLVLEVNTTAKLNKNNHIKKTEKLFTYELPQKLF